MMTNTLNAVGRTGVLVLASLLTVFLSGAAMAFVSLLLARLVPERSSRRFQRLDCIGETWRVGAGRDRIDLGIVLCQSLFQSRREIIVRNGVERGDPDVVRRDRSRTSRARQLQPLGVHDGCTRKLTQTPGGVP